MNQKKTILLINDFQTGGGAEAIFNLTAKTFAADYNIVVYTAHDNFSEMTSNPLTYLFSRKHYKQVYALIVKHNVDIVHIHNFRWVSPSVFLAKRNASKKLGKSVQLFLTPHDFSIISPYAAHGYFDAAGQYVPFALQDTDLHFFFKRVDPRGHLHSWLKKMQWYLAFSFFKIQKDIDLVLSPSYFLGKEIKLFYPQLPVFLLRNPLISESVPMKSGIQLRPITTELKMIYLGRIAPEKGVVELLKSLKFIYNKNSNLNFKLDIYGNGSQSETIRKMLRQEDMPFAAYKGFAQREAIPEILSSHNVFVMSSVCYENSPLSVVEAAAAGLRLLVPDFGGMKESAELCGNAYYFNIYKPDTLRLAMEQLLYQRKEIPMAQVQKNIQDNFDIEKYIRKLASFYENAGVGTALDLNDEIL